MIALACRVGRSGSSFAVVHLFGLEHRVVPIDEGHGIRVNRVLGGNGEVSRDVAEVFVPTLEGITLTFRVGRRGSGFAVVHFLGLEGFRIPIDEGHGVRVDGVLGFDGKVGRDIIELLIPSGEGVACHSRCIRCRSGLAVLYLLIFQRLAVFIDEGHGIYIDSILRFDGQVRSDIVELLVPSREVVARHSRCVRCRSRLAVLHLLGLEGLVVLIDEGHGIYIDFILRGDDEVRRYFVELLVPTREVVTRHCRCIRSSRCAVLDDGFGLERVTFAVLERDGIESGEITRVVLAAVHMRIGSVGRFGFVEGRTVTADEFVATEHLFRHGQFGCFRFPVGVAVDGFQVRTCLKHTGHVLYLADVEACEVDFLEEGAVIEHTAHVLYFRGVERAEVHALESVAEHEHTNHVFHILGVEGCEVQRFERVAEREHTVHADCRSGVEVLQAFYLRQGIEAVEPVTSRENICVLYRCIEYHFLHVSYLRRTVPLGGVQTFLRIFLVVAIDSQCLAVIAIDAVKHRGRTLREIARLRLSAVRTGVCDIGMVRIELRTFVATQHGAGREHTVGTNSRTLTPVVVAIDGYEVGA